MQYRLNDRFWIVAILVLAGALGMLFFSPGRAPLPSRPPPKAVGTVNERVASSHVPLPPVYDAAAARPQEQPEELSQAEVRLLQALEDLEFRAIWFRPPRGPWTLQGIGTAETSGKAFRAQLRALLKSSNSEAAIYNIACHLAVVGDRNDADALVDKLATLELQPIASEREGEPVLDRLFQALVHSAEDRTPAVLRMLIEDDSLYVKLRAAEHLLHSHPAEAAVTLVDAAFWDDAACHLSLTHRCLRWACDFHHSFVKERAAEVLDRIFRKNRSDEQPMPKGYNEWKAWIAVTGKNFQIPNLEPWRK